jgi:uncharacterized membrane protein
VDGFLVLLGFGLFAAVIGVPIAAFVALSRTGKLQSAIAALELQVQRLRGDTQELQRRLDDAAKQPQGATAAFPSEQRATAETASQPAPVEAPAAPAMSVALPAAAQPPAEPLAAPTMAEPAAAPMRVIEPIGSLRAADAAAAAETAPPEYGMAPPIDEAAVRREASDAPSSDAAPSSRPPAATAVVGLEERLGGRLFIWIGGIALALAGAFLVKYSIDQGWLGPAVRCSLGVALGVVFLGGGEWMRAREERIAQSLSAAGIAVLYASLFASISLYHLIDPTSGFLVLAGLTAGAIALALRQGPFVALLGLAGGFITPAIVHSDEPHALVLFVYLFAIQLGSQVLMRRRGWWWPSAIAVGGGFLWAALWIGTMPRDWANDVWLAVFLLASSAAAAWVARATVAPPKLEEWRPAHWQGLATHALALVLMTGLAAAAHYDLNGWLFFGLLAAGQMALARFRPEQELVAALAAVFAALLLTGWPLAADALTADTSRFIGVALAIGGVFGLGGFAALWGARQPVRWALLSTLSATAFFLIAYARLRGIEGLPSWALVSLAIAALSTVAAGFVGRVRAISRSYEESLGVYALAASGFIAFAIPMELEHAWMAVGWSLLLPAIAWIESRLHIAWFRYAAWVAAGLVMVRLLPGPWVADFPIGATPVFNWLLYGYGVPLVAFGGAAWLFRRERDDALVTFLEAGAVAIGFLLVTLELHHFFEGSLDYRFNPDLVEVTSFAVAWLLIALGLARAARLDPRPARLWGMRIVTGLAVTALIGGSLVAVNPLIALERVGDWPLLNWLPFAYALPALLLAAIAREIQASSERGLAIWLQGLAGALGLLFVSLEIRQLFHGAILMLGDVGLAELSCLVIAWLVIALGLFYLSGRVRQTPFLAMARTVAGLAVAAVVLGSLLYANPVLSPQEVGAWPLFNWLVPAYAVPALLVAILGRDLRDPKRSWIALSLGSLALLLGFVFVTLELRQWFQGSRLDGGDIGSAENYAYSVGWILYGVALLVAGIVRGGATLRWASLVVVVVAMGKVFLLDAAVLTGLYRVASFFGLGVSLMVIGYVYQRVVFRSAAGPIPAVTPQPTRS